MDFAYSPKVQELRERVSAFMEAHVYPAEAVFERQVAEGDRWQPTAIMEELKAKAKAEGLWNLFLPESEYGAGLANHEYAPLAEIMGRSLIGPEPFNCAAPDTGNMEVLVRYGSEEQKRTWLEPLLSGEIRSAFAMTEPGVASSGRHQYGGARRAPGRRLGDQRAQVVDFRRLRSALQDPDLHGPDQPGRAAPPAALDDPGTGRHPRGEDPPPAAGVRLRRRAAWPCRSAVRERAGALRERHPRRGPRFRDRPGAPRPGPHPPLHALHRHGRARPRTDVQARGQPYRVRQAAGAPGRQHRPHRRLADGDQHGAPADPAGRLHDGYRGQQDRPERNRPDQGGGAQRGVEGDRPGDPDARWRRGFQRLPAGLLVRHAAHPAPGRRPGRGAPRGDRQFELGKYVPREMLRSSR